MNKNNRGRRGATLAELAIVIAVIAIVAVMVTSFIVMIDGSRDISQMKLEAMQDIVLAESVIENFIENGANEGKEISFPSERRLVVKDVGSIMFANDTLFVYYDDNDLSDVSMTLETVKSISFKAYDENLGAADNIFYCTITYNVGGDSDFEYTFCVNPYAGEKIETIEGGN